MSSSMSPLDESGESVESSWRDHLQLAHKIVLPAILVYIMLAMGCTITAGEVFKHLRRPVGAAIGACCQFVLMPLVGFGLANVCGLATAEALGLILMACCPAGGMSNLFTYWVEGDVSLSICMTTFSTVLALCMMPLNLFIYSKAWSAAHPSGSSYISDLSLASVSPPTEYTSNSTTESTEIIFSPEVIPYEKILITLASTLIPVMVGIFIRRRWPKAAIIIAKLGSVAGLLAIGAAMTMQAFLFSWHRTQEWQFWTAPGLLSLLGFVFGYIAAVLLRQPYKLCRTIGFETGSQNVSLAISVVVLTFPRHLQGRIILVQVLYGVFLPFTGGSLVALYYLMKRCRSEVPTEEYFGKESGQVEAERSSSGYATAADTDTGDSASDSKLSVHAKEDGVSVASSISALGLVYKNGSSLSSEEFITNV